MLKDDLLNCARRHFALFFLAALGISAFPVCCSILNDTAKKMLLHYDAQQKASLGDITAAKRVLPTPQDNKSTGIVTGIGKKMPPAGTKLFPTREEVEKQSARALPFRDEFSTFNMAFKRLCGMVRPIEGDRTIILPDGRLTQADAIPYMPVSGFSDAELALIRSFRDSCTAGTRFFAVMRPHNTVDKPGIYVPYTGVTISRGAVQAKQCRQLQELGITVFEMNEKLKNV